jgi:hypothetical protein
LQLRYIEECRPHPVPISSQLFFSCPVLFWSAFGIGWDFLFFPASFTSSSLVNLSAELFSSWSQVLLWPRQDLLTFPPPSSTIGCWTPRVHCTLSSKTRVHSAYVTATSISHCVFVFGRVVKILAQRFLCGG